MAHDDEFDPMEEAVSRRRPRAAPSPPTNGSDSSMLKQWANAIGIVGIPGAIAIFLVYVGATEIPKLSRGVEQAIIESKQTQAMLERQIEQTQVLIAVTQRTCASVAVLAKTEEAKEMAREKCYER